MFLTGDRFLPENAADPKSAAFFIIITSLHKS
jgi:hypothetical protein